MESETTTRILRQHQYSNGVSNLWEVVRDGRQIKTYYHFEYDYVLRERYEKGMYKMMNEKKMMEAYPWITQSLETAYRQLNTEATLPNADLELQKNRILKTLNMIGIEGEPK